MAKMTPEQEAAYALRWGLARNDLPAEAQLAYDRLTEQQARAAASAPIRPAAAGAASSPVILPGWAAAVGTALVFLIAQGTAVVLLPYAFTHWQPGTPPWPVAVRAIGVALIVAGGIMVIWGFVRFATEGPGYRYRPSRRHGSLGRAARSGHPSTDRCPAPAGAPGPQRRRSAYLPRPT